MDNKQIRIEPMIEPKTSPKMERMIKQYGVMWQKATQFGDLSKGNKELEKRLKYMGQWATKDKELARIMGQHSNKALEQQKVVLQNIGKEVDKNVTRYKNAESIAAKWAQRATDRASARYSGIGGIPDFVSRNIAAGQAGMAGRIQGSATGNIMAGSEALMDKVRQEEDARQAERAERQRRLYSAGLGLQVTGAAMQQFGDIFYGSTLKGMGYRAAQYGLAERLYNEGSAGDYTSIRALSGTNKDVLMGLMSDQATASKLGLGGKFVGGIGKVATGAASAGQGGGTNAIFGASTIAGGLFDMGGAANDYRLGKVEADVARATGQGIDYINAMDPIKLRQFRELTARASGLREFGALSGQTGGAASEGLARAAAGGGLTLDQAMPLHGIMRAGIGHGAASGLMGGVATSLETMGIGQSAAAQSLAGLSGLQGGAEGAMGKLQSIMRRAMASGIEDSKLKETLALTIPSLINRGVGGRGVDVDSATAMIARSAQNMAMREGRSITQSDIGVATGAYQLHDQALSGGSGLGPMDVKRQSLVIGLARRMGLSSEATTALANVTSNDVRNMKPGSHLWNMLSKDENWDDDKIRQFQTSFGGVGTEAFNATVGGAFKGKYTKLVVGGQVLGTTAETHEQGLGMTGRAGALPEGAMTQAASGTQEALARQQKYDALNKMGPLLQALGDEKMMTGLTNTTIAFQSLSNVLDGFAKNDPEKLRDLPAILDNVSVALQGLSRVAQGFLGTVYQTNSMGQVGSITIGGQGVTPVSTNKGAPRGAPPAGAFPPAQQMAQGH